MAWHLGRPNLLRCRPADPIAADRSVIDTSRNEEKKGYRVARRGKTPSELTGAKDIFQVTR